MGVLSIRILRVMGRIPSQKGTQRMTIARRYAGPASVAWDGSHASKQTELTQRDLEELFKRTSNFTVKQVSMGYNPDDFDDIELLRMEYDDIDEFEEEK